MAGYIYSLIDDDNTEFHVGPGVEDRVRKLIGPNRVVTLQLDGDELDAALWGLEHYSQQPTEEEREFKIHNIFHDKEG